MTLESYSHEGPKCPHCEYTITADQPHFYDEQSYTKETCPMCAMTFAVRVEMTTAWACEEIEQEGK